MPIYKNDKEITKVYQGGTEINKIYHGDKLVFDNVPAPPAKLDRILLYDFGGKDYFPTTAMAHGEWTVRKHTNYKNYTSLVFNTNLVPAFRMPFNAMNAQLSIEMSVSRMRNGANGYGSAKVLFALVNDPNYDITDGWISEKEVLSADAQSRFTNNNGFNVFAVKDSNFVQDDILPTYPAMKYWCYKQGLSNRAFTDGTNDTYFMAFMYMLTNSDINNNKEGYVKLGKVYLDLTTDPQYQTYLNS